MSIFCSQCGASLEYVQLRDGAYHCPDCAAEILIPGVEPGTRSLPIDAAAPTIQYSSQSDSKSLHFGRFRLLEKIGQGGFGSVYRSHDTQLNRIVALKIPHNGEILSAEQKEQFLREAQRAAALEHAGIVPIYDFGESAGVPFIVSQFVKGETLGEYMTGNRIPYKESAEIVAQIGDALQHAHERMLVHRDVKPGNIMLGKNRRPLLMDFGLAIDTARDLRVTSEGRIKGTPAYMSPEQATGESHRIDHRTDIYSLGVVLYELLTGERPFQGVHQKVIDQIRSDEPRSLRSFNIKIPVDLQTICQKAMDKDPRRRYQSAQDFADELRRWINNEPIIARPIGRFGRIARWCRRHPGVTTSVSAIVFILFVASIVSTKLYLDARGSLIRERASLEIERTRTAQLSVSSSEQFIRNDILTAIPWLAQAYQLDKDNSSREPTSRLRLQCALRSSPQLESLWFHEAPVTSLAVSRDRRRFASASVDGVIRIWDAATGKLVTECFGHKKSIERMKFTPDGSHFVSAGTDSVVRVWNITSGELVAERSYPRPFFNMDVSPSGEVIATAHDDNRVRLWTWREPGNQNFREFDHGANVMLLSFHPTEPRLATAGLNPEIRIWNVETSEEIKPGIRHDMNTNALTYSHNGRYLAAAVIDVGFKSDLKRQVQVWDSETLQPRFANPPTVAKPPSMLVFSADDSLIATLAQDREQDAVTVSASGDGTLLIPALKYGGAMSAIDCSPNGRLLAAACKDGFVRLWNARDGALHGMPMRHGGPVNKVSFLDDTNILSCSNDHCVRLWKVEQERPLIPLGSGSLVDAALSADGRRLVVGSKDRTARVCDLEGTASSQLPSLVHKGSVASVSFSPDGTQIATGSADGTAQLWNSKNGTPTLAPFTHFSPVRAVRFSPSGDQLATVCRDHLVRIWNCRTGKLESQLEHPERATDVCYSPGGDRLATASFDKHVLVWDPKQPAPTKPLMSLVHPGSILKLVYHPTGRFLLSACADNILRVWDCTTDEPIASFAGHQNTLKVAKFSPDGERVLSLDDDGMVKIWETRTGTEYTPAFDFGSRTLDAAFGHDGKLIVCIGSDRTVRVWDSISGEPVSPPRMLPEQPFRGFLLMHSQHIAAVTINGLVFTDSLVGREEEHYDPALEAELFTAHRVIQGGGVAAIDPHEYRTLFDPARTRIKFPQLGAP